MFDLLEEMYVDLENAVGIIACAINSLSIEGRSKSEVTALTVAERILDKNIKILEKLIDIAVRKPENMST